ncbi:MAG: hypothetical protein JWP92_2098 [Caulobacter sp.]|nr:hypothetical protein [Caulobacter sp.]
MNHGVIRASAVADSSRRRVLGSVLTLAGLALVCGADRAAAQTPPAAPVAPASSATVAANLNISPKRVTFDRTGRSATVYIFNQGGAPGAFDISVVDRVMLPDGQILPLAEAEAKPELKDLVARQKSAKAMIMVTPRRATLAPGKGQTIRIRIAPDPAAPDAAGEFRSHLTVTTIPPPDIGLTAEQAAAATPGQLQFVINSVFGLSIPVIVRVGAPDVRAAIENAKLGYAEVSADGVSPAKRTPVVNFDLVRAGGSSLFGNIEIRGKGRGEPLGVARGVGVYTEIDRRAMQIPLSRAPNPGEALEITFSDDDTSPGALLAKGAVGP